MLSPAAFWEAIKIPCTVHVTPRQVGQTIILIIHNHCSGCGTSSFRGTTMIIIIVRRIEPNDSQLPMPTLLDKSKLLLTNLALILESRFVNLERRRMRRGRRIVYDSYGWIEGGQWGVNLEGRDHDRRAFTLLVHALIIECLSRLLEKNVANRSLRTMRLRIRIDCGWWEILNVSIWLK